VLSDGAILDDLETNFNVTLRDDKLVAGKTAIFEILSLAEVCAV